MSARFCFVMATSALAFAAWQLRAPAAQPEQADELVVEVAASYAGANAQTVAETVAAPIEEQIHGVEGQLRIESKSSHDGKYTARVHFKAKTDAKLAAKLVQKRVALATPSLPDEVQRIGVSVKVGKAEVDRDKVAIAVIDRRGHGWEALEKAAASVAKRLATEGAIMKPVAFPQNEKQVHLEIDREKCARRGVSVAEVYAAVEAAGPAAKINDLKKVVMGKKVPLGEVAAFKEVAGPAAVYRVDRHPAVRITGNPPDGKSAARTTARCVELAEAELKRIGSGGFAPRNLSAK
jgi:multidrug efflux pump subunit AcrB